MPRRTTRLKSHGKTSKKIVQDAASAFRVHFLDMGTTQFGDCIVCEVGSRLILIDGGHPGDQKPRGSTPALQDQIAQLLKRPKPFTFDLLVVTHTHKDHIGCLPTLVADGTVRAKVALVADEKLGYGISGTDALATDANPNTRLILHALREDVDHAGMSDRDLEGLLAAVDGLEDSYKQMLAALEQAGTNVIRYRTPADGAKVEKLFKDVGLKVLGPSKSHLEMCRDRIADLGRSASDAIDAITDAAATPGEKLREVLASMPGADVTGSADSAGGIGAAINNQSIILSLTRAGRTILIPGDMQFAVPQVPGLDQEMAALRKKVEQSGPFHAVKTAHHTSFNGMSPAILAMLKGNKVFVHSGGSNDDKHPEQGALDVLRAVPGITFARTDHDGVVTLTLTKSAVKVTTSRGVLNDFTLNPASSPHDSELPGPASSAVARVSSNDPDRVVVTASIPNRSTRVTITVDVQPRTGKGGAPRVEVTTQPEEGSTPILVEASDAAARLADGRQLPRLLFVTRSSALRANIGAPGATRVASLIQAAGHQLFDLGDASDIQSAIAQVRAKTAAGGGGAFEGVVLVGGPDVVPSQRLDALPAPLRQTLGATTRRDADNYIVWSDDGYGDFDGDGEPELPVSRIPDGRARATVVAALSSPRRTLPNPRAGIRNSQRPFAAPIYSALPGTASLHASGPDTYAAIGPTEFAADRVYIMLHGSDADATQFWGEDPDAGYVVGVALSNIVPLKGGIGLAGCCWGAMTADAKASAPITLVRGRTAADSIAVKFISKGGRAFVGCTGSHYSPTIAPYAYFGGPIHRSFWQGIAAGEAPARALWLAKKQYKNDLPHGQNEPLGRAIELKILRQFTCVGIGW